MFQQGPAPFLPSHPFREGCALLTLQGLFLAHSWSTALTHSVPEVHCQEEDRAPFRENLYIKQQLA